MSAPQFWSDAPAVGAYQEHEVDSVFKPAAFASLLFRLAEKRKLASGDSLTVPSFANLDMPSSTGLVEDELIPVSKLTISAKTIAMNAKGRAVVIGDLAVNRSPFDVLSAHKEELGVMMTRELEAVCATALKLMPVKYVATGVASQTISTNGTAGAAATHNLNVYHLRYLSNYMSDVLRIPYHPSYGSFVSIFRGNALVSLQSDPEFLEIHKSQNSSVFAGLELQGKIADIAVLKHNDDNVLDRALGNANNVSEGFILGKQPLLFGMIEQIKLIYDFSEGVSTDFGRRKYIAWKGDYGAGLFSDSANAGLVRGIHWSSNV
jgi:hypothetical protein